MVLWEGVSPLALLGILDHDLVPQFIDLGELLGVIRSDPFNIQWGSDGLSGSEPGLNHVFSSVGEHISGFTESSKCEIRY